MGNAVQAQQGAVRETAIETRLLKKVRNLNQLKAGTVGVAIGAAVDAIGGGASGTYTFTVRIKNKTNEKLCYKGAYNRSGSWPLGSIEAMCFDRHSWNGKHHSFAGQYTIAGRYLSLCLSSPYVGCNKIDAKFSKNVYKHWNDMTDGDTKVVYDGKYRVEALMQKNSSRITWTFTISYN